MEVEVSGGGDKKMAPVVLEHKHMHASDALPCAESSIQHRHCCGGWSSLHGLTSLLPDYFSAATSFVFNLCSSSSSSLLSHHQVSPIRISYCHRFATIISLSTSQGRCAPPSSLPHVELHLCMQKLTRSPTSRAPPSNTARRRRLEAKLRHP